MKPANLRWLFRMTVVAVTVQRIYAQQVVSKAREEFPEVVNRAAYGKERTIVSRRGKDLAAVIPIEDLRLLERLAQEEMDRIDIADARAALKEAADKGTIPLRELMRELGD